jgi:hypothetical protein
LRISNIAVDDIIQEARSIDARRILPNDLTGLLPVLKKVVTGFFKGAAGKRDKYVYYGLVPSAGY